MTIKRFIIFVISILPLGCMIQEKKSNSDWWIKCKPMSDIMGEISKVGEYNKSGLEKLLKRNEGLKDCNDGVYGEGIADIVAKSLASDFANIATATIPNKELGSFIIKHINSSADWADLDKISNHAKIACPAGAKEFCQKVRSLSKMASEEAKTAVKK